MTKALRSPLAWIAIGAIATILPMAVAGESAWPVSLAGLCLFSVASPLAGGLGHQWWRDTVVSLVAWVVIFVIAGQLPAMNALREGAMVFMLPMLIYPVALLVSGVIRLVRWRRASRVGSP